MDPFAAIEESWTGERVESRLIAAFKVLPGAAVFRAGPRLQDRSGRQNIITEALNWAPLLDDDPAGRTYLWAWAR